LTSHLRSRRSGKKKRHLGRESILDEGHAKRFRGLMAISGKKPARVVHERALKEQEPATEAK
jgi:hypothetical protein